MNKKVLPLWTLTLALLVGIPLFLAWPTSEKSVPLKPKLIRPDDPQVRRIYEDGCAGCHDSAVAGAPRPGDAEAWAARRFTGENFLVNSVIKGKGAMPPKGDRPHLTPEQIRGVVRWMLSVSPHL